MNGFAVPILTALMLGFLHALEVDHMIAVTTFVTGRPSAGHAARFGFRWGLGHSAAVMALGAVLLVTGLRWPARFDAAGEAVVGVMLFLLGAWALRSSRKLHLHPPAGHGDHAHLHLHTGEATHGHHHDADHPEGAPHHHDDEARHAHGHQHHVAHGHGITLVGLMHGLAGTGAVVALLPVALMSRLDLGLVYLLAFGVGTTVGMTAYATIAAYAVRRAASRSVSLGRGIMQGVGIVGMGVGAWWVGRALG